MALSAHEQGPLSAAAQWSRRREASEAAEAFLQYPIASRGLEGRKAGCYFKGAKSGGPLQRPDAIAEWTMERADCGMKVQGESRSTEHRLLLPVAMRAGGGCRWRFHEALHQLIRLIRSVLLTSYLDHECPGPL